MFTFHSIWRQICCCCNTWKRKESFVPVCVHSKGKHSRRSFKNDHLVSLTEAQWILCNILNVRCKQSCRASLQELKVLSLLGSWMLSVPLRKGKCPRAWWCLPWRCWSPACWKAFLLSAYSRHWHSGELLPGSGFSYFRLRKILGATFMERPQTHLVFQFWHRPGFDVGLVSVKLVNSSGGGKSDISTNIFWSVICLEAQVLWVLSDWYPCQWLLSLSHMGLSLNQMQWYE